MKYHAILFGCALLPFALSAHAAPPPPFTATAASPTTSDTKILDRYVWILSSATDASGHRIDAFFPRPERPLQLRFTQDRLNVGNSCNLIAGDFRVADGRLKVGTMMQTMMYCSDRALNDLDDAISRHLGHEPQFYLYDQYDRPELRLGGQDGQTLVFTGALVAAPTVAPQEHSHP